MLNDRVNKSKKRKQKKKQRSKSSIEMLETNHHKLSAKKYNSKNQLNKLLFDGKLRNFQVLDKLLSLVCEFECDNPVPTTNNGNVVLKPSVPLIVTKKFDDLTIKENIQNYKDDLFLIRSSIGKSYTKNLKPKEYKRYSFTDIPIEITNRRGVYIIEHEDGRCYIGKADNQNGFHGREASYNTYLTNDTKHNEGLELLKDGARMNWLFVCDEDMFNLCHRYYGFNYEVSSIERIEMLLIALFKDYYPKCVNKRNDQLKLDKHYTSVVFNLSAMGVFNVPILQKYLGDNAKGFGSSIRTELDKLDIGVTKYYYDIV